MNQKQEISAIVHKWRGLARRAAISSRTNKLYETRLKAKARSDVYQRAALDIARCLRMTTTNGNAKDNANLPVLPNTGDLR